VRLIYVDIDSLRPDHLGCYGYARQTSPHIDRIAARGVRFDRAYTASSPCGPARTSFITGRFAINHGALNHGPASPGGRFQRHDGPFVSRVLRQAGYRTVSFSSFADRHRAWWFNACWDEVHAFSLKLGFEDASEVNAAVLPWLRAHGRDENWFLHVQYWDPHIEHRMGGGYPHDHFAEYVDRFAGQPIDPFPDEELIRAHFAQPQPCSARYLLANARPHQELPPTMPAAITSRRDFERLIDGYDAAIWYLDRHLGQVLATLRELGIEEETGFVISADHGESFGEHNTYGEHASATEAVNHVPLVISLPEITAPGTVSDALVYNVDWVATIAELLGADVPPQWDGRSFAAALKGGAGDAPEYLVLDHGLFIAQRAVVDGRWFFIRTLHPGLFHFDPVSLYDLEADPHETTNVANRNPEIVAQMEHRLNVWTQAQLDRTDAIPDPLLEIAHAGPWRIFRPERWIERYRQDGFDEEAERIGRLVRARPGY
jgi:arylsulfatase A-like enzyme